jgi:hypothetical protein
MLSLAVAMSKRRRDALCALGVLSLAAPVAEAQRRVDTSEVRIDVSGEAVSTGSSPLAESDGAARAREGEWVIVVIERPSGWRSPGQTVAPSLLDRERPGSSEPPRDVPDSPEQQARSYAPGLVFGANVGVAGPSGLLGAFVEASPVRALTARVGAGLGLNFGPSLEVATLLRPFRFGRFAPIASLSYSTNFTPDLWRNLSGLSAPQNSHWLTPAIGLELRLRPVILMRLSVGVCVLLNTGDFSNREFEGWYGPPRPPRSVGFTPLSAADARDAGRALVMPGVWFDFGAVGPHW